MNYAKTSRYLTEEREKWLLATSLPVKFMLGGMGPITDRLIPLVFDTYRNQPLQGFDLLRALNAVMNFSLMVMQHSYQSTSLAAKLKHFPVITGMNRNLFENLASDHHNRHNH